MRSLCITSILFLSCFLSPTYAAEDLPAGWDRDGGIPADWKALFEQARAECKPPANAGIVPEISWGELVKLTQTSFVLEHGGRTFECSPIALV